MESSALCIEGLFEGQKKRERIDPEVLFIGAQMRVQFGPGPRASEVLQKPFRRRGQWAIGGLGQA